MTAFSFEEISEQLAKMSFPEVDLVLAIGMGGVVPASLIANRIDKPMRILFLQFQDRGFQPPLPGPRFTPDFDLEEGKRLKILLVDARSITGKTMAQAKGLLPGHQVVTLVYAGKADLVVFPEVQGAVRWPWE